MFLTNLLLTIIIFNYSTKGATHQQTEATAFTSASDAGEETEHHVSLSDPSIFTHMIFDKYGEGDKIPFEGLEHLMESLGLGNIDIPDHDLTSHKEEDHVFRTMHDTHEHSKDLVEESTADKRQQRVASSTENYQTSDKAKIVRKTADRNRAHHHISGGHDHGHHSETGISVPHSHNEHDHTDMPSAGRRRKPSHHQRKQHIDEQFSGSREIQRNKVEKQNEIFHANVETYLVKRCLSPVQILEILELNANSSLDTVNFLHICPVIIWELDQQHCTHRHSHDSEIKTVTLKQWIFCSLAILLISLCGLFSVAVIPIMQKWFYHTLLQFLVGLAVGSLSGDAMLHLLPHAMTYSEDNHDHSRSNEHEELEAMWRGMAALGGIYFFFLSERLLNALSTYRTRRKNKAPIPNSTHPALQAQGSDVSSGSVGEKLSHYRKNSYGVKVGPDGKETMQMLQGKEESAGRRDSRHSSVHEVAFHGRSSFSADPHSGSLYHAFPADSDPENYVVTVTEHHGHGHGHSHEVPQSITAVAWMVIMGDGLHNFCDGMAIGAAFASGIPGGISTTVAVFCHELPHELGDFAMLLKTGMKVKQALLYNGLSSVLCFIGMVIGLSLGSVHSATSWIFAVTAGMFLYIALVDMLPELSMSNEEPESTQAYTLAVQVLGISTGVSVMLIIAIYEHDLMRNISS